MIAVLGQMVWELAGSKEDFAREYRCVRIASSSLVSLRASCGSNHERKPHHSEEEQTDICLQNMLPMVVLTGMYS